METREQYEEMVKGPGKFEGEPAWVPYLWGLAMDGQSSDEIYDEDVLLAVFRLSASDEDWSDVHQMFSEIRQEGIENVVLWSDDLGFVRHKCASDRELKRIYDERFEEMDDAEDEFC